MRIGRAGLRRNREIHSETPPLQQWSDVDSVVGGMAVAFESHDARFAAGMTPQAANGNSNSRREPCRTDRIACRGDAQEDAMTALVNFYNSIRRNDEGQDLLEYALLVALIAIVAVGAVTSAGQTVATIFGNIAAAI